MLNFLIIELGISVPSLHDSFKQYGGWITTRWIKFYWEKCNELKIGVKINDGFIELPRKNDKWIMREFMHIGYTKDKLARLNRTRLYMHVLFLSHVLGASKKDLDRRHLKRRPPGVKWSTSLVPTLK